MLVRMIGDISGLRDGKPWPRRGHTIDLPEVEARDLLLSDMAVEVKAGEKAEVETAAVDTKPKQARKAGLTKASLNGADEAPVETADAPPEDEAAAPEPPAAEAPPES